MARPVKWSRDLHPLRERAARSRTETWSRTDLEALFGIGRASAQSLMKAIGQVEVVGGVHFVERPALLGILDAMIASPSIEEALRQRMAEASPALKPRTLRVSLPEDLRRARMPDLPANISLEPGRLRSGPPQQSKCSRASSPWPWSCRTISTAFRRSSSHRASRQRLTTKS